MVASLLAAGADPNAANSGGQSPIHYAASKGHLDCIRKLVAAGCDPDAVDRTKSTPLHRAASQGRANVIVSMTDGSVLGPDGSGTRCAIDAALGFKRRGRLPERRVPAQLEPGVHRLPSNFRECCGPVS